MKVAGYLFGFRKLTENLAWAVLVSLRMFTAFGLKKKYLKNGFWRFLVGTFLYFSRVFMGFLGLSAAQRSSKPWVFGCLFGWY